MTKIIYSLSSINMENQSYDKIEILLKKDANIELIKELVTSTL